MAARRIEGAIIRGCRSPGTVPRSIIAPFVLRPLLSITALSLLYGLCRGIRSFFLLFVRQDSGEALLPALARNLSFGEFLAPAFLWMVAGAALGGAVALGLSRWRGVPVEECFEALARPYRAVLAPVALTVFCAASFVLSPSFPYGSNLAVSLCLEGAFFDLLTFLVFALLLAHALVRLLGAWERPIPAIAIIAVAMLCFTWATPSRFYAEGVGQGNMFKYVRMAQTLAGTGTLDIERAEENAHPTFSDFASFAPRWIGAALDATVHLATGPDDDKKATRVNRSMFRSVNGGVHYINAPGPGVLLTPAYIADRYLNRWFGFERQVAIIVFWQLLGALVVVEIVRSTSSVARPMAGVLTAFGVALSVPFLFYTFQIYPELPAALLILYAFRKLVLELEPSGFAVLASSISLAVLPWLHQKYSVLAAVLGVLAALTLSRRSIGGIRHHPYKLALLAVPLALSAFTIFLYNHALTGSLSPTATFEAAERSSFEPWNALRGMSGLLFDQENGLFVFAPIYLLALVGARALFFEGRRFFVPLVLVLASYLVVIASFPYWPGAISTMGRYILSVLPLFAIPMAIVVDRALTDGRLAGVTATLMAGSLAFSASFVADLIPSYQPWLFWERALYSDPLQYLPRFLSEGVLGSGTAHFVKYGVLLGVVALLVIALRDRVYREPESLGTATESYHRQALLAVVALLVVVMGAGTVVEHWPANVTDKSGPEFRDDRVLPRARTLAVFGEHGFEGGGVWVPGGGTTQFLLRATSPLSELDLRFLNGPDANTVVFRERGSSAVELELPPRGTHDRTVRLRKPYRFEGPRGERLVYSFSVESVGSFVPADEGLRDDDRSLGTFVRVR